MSNFNTNRAEIVSSAIEGVRRFSQTKRGAGVVDIKPKDDNSFIVVLQDGTEVHFSTVEL